MIDEKTISAALAEVIFMIIERPSFSRATPEKLGLFSAYRWLCSFRGETEFLPAPHPKNSVSSLFFVGFVLSGERPSFFPRHT
jgi:hypothetical protein